MSYQVLARKWRPQQFDEVVGQEHVVTTLKNAITTGRVAHAYLFVGPRGVGKTTLARIFARDLNCVKGPTVQACGVCDSCREIAAGVNLDVQEIDAASHRGIENIRELRENARFLPRGRFKIYIIDEVHMLTTEAFNALLKTLEEPPPHLKFFLATTDPQKIPATILSRCQRFDLRRIPAPLIAARLQEIAQAEKLEIAPAALQALARAADGGLRDAESALDQMIAFHGQQISEQDVLSAFGMVSQQALVQMADALLSGDALQVVRLVAELDNYGKDMQRLLVELIEYFRDLLIWREAGAEAQRYGLLEAENAAVQRLAEKADVPRLLRIMEILMEAVDRVRFALSRRTLVETALIRCAHLAQAVMLDELLGEFRQLRRQLAGGDAPPPAAPAAPAMPAEAARSPAAAAPLLAAEQTPPAAPAPLHVAPVEQLRARWPEVMEQVGKLAVRARNYLLDAMPLAVKDDAIVIGIDREFADRLELLRQPRNLAALQKALAAVIGRTVAVEFELADKLPAPPPPAAHPVKKKHDLALRAYAAGKEAGKPADHDPVRKWMADEKVQKVLDAFNGNILEIRE